MQQTRELLWKSKIAVKIDIQQGQIPPIYLFIYRQHYLIFYFQQIFDHFIQFLNQNYKAEEIKLYYKDKELPYNVPFGVLFDLNVNQEDFSPVNIYLQFGALKQFVSLELEKECQFTFNLKQALIARYKNTHNLTQYSDQQNNLQFFNYLSSYQEFEPHQIWLFNKYDNSVLSLIYQIFQDQNKDVVINIPIRVYSQKINGRIQAIVTVKNQADTMLELLQKATSFQEFLYGGIPLKDIPAMYFYKWFYQIDGFCYFVAK